MMRRNLDQFPGGLVHKQHLNLASDVLISAGLAALTETIHVAQAHDTSLAISGASYNQDQMLIHTRGYCKYPVILHSNHFRRYVLHTEIGRQDVAIGNYRVQVIRIIDRICVSATVEHSSGVQVTEPNFATNTDAKYVGIML